VVVVIGWRREGLKLLPPQHKSRDHR
jgi:hypothetical protein